MGATNTLVSQTAQAERDQPAVCTGPGCGVLMVYPEFRLPDDFLATRASKSRCAGCSRHGGKGLQHSKTAGVLEDMEFLLAVGENVHQIAPRVGYRNTTTMYRLLKRRGRVDLIERLQATVADADPWGH